MVGKHPFDLLNKLPIVDCCVHALIICAVHLRNELLPAFQLSLAQVVDFVRYTHESGHTYTFSWKCIRDVMGLVICILVSRAITA